MAWDDSVVTLAGVEMINKYALTGTALQAAGAAGGTGTVPTALLLMQTGLASHRQDLPITSIKDVEGGKRFGVQITNKSLESGYTLNQIGIWMQPADGDPILAAIMQDQAGISIPAFSQNELEFVIDFFVVIPISNESTISLNVDTSALVTQGELSSLRDELAAKSIFFTIPAGDDPAWDGDGTAAPYTCSVDAAEARAWMTPTADVVMSDDLTDGRAQLKAWGCIDKMETLDCAVCVSCYTHKPAVAVPVVLVSYGGGGGNG